MTRLLIELPDEQLERFLVERMEAPGKGQMDDADFAVISARLSVAAASKGNG